MLSASTSTTTQIILSPHFDDAALPIGGMLAQSIDRKVVVTVFSGKPDKGRITLWDTISGFFSSNKAIDTREKENNNSLKILNAESVSLGFVDYQYKVKLDVDKKKESIKLEIKKILDRESKDHKISVYFPAYFGPSITHKDHLLLHDVALGIVKSDEFKKISWYMYEDLPYTMNFLYKNKITLKKFLENEHVDFDFEEISINLSKDNLDKKAESIGLYTSQIRAFHFMGYSLKRIMDFTKKRCDGKACEKVYRVEKKSF
jgi:LmbE family N-acetylglucosaminyl deacetylase